MLTCGICDGEAPRQPRLTEDGKWNLCGNQVMLAEGAKKDKPQQ